MKKENTIVKSGVLVKNGIIWHDWQRLKANRPQSKIHVFHQRKEPLVFHHSECVYFQSLISAFQRQRMGLLVAPALLKWFNFLLARDFTDECSPAAVCKEKTAMHLWKLQVVNLKHTCSASAISSSCHFKSVRIKSRYLYNSKGENCSKKRENQNMRYFQTFLIVQPTCFSFLLQHNK